MQNLQNVFAVTCPPLSLENGRVNYTRDPVDGGYPWKTVASFECDEYFILEGWFLNRTCLRQEYWDGAAPECLEECSD